MGVETFKQWLAENPVEKVYKCQHKGCNEKIEILGPSASYCDTEVKNEGWEYTQETCFCEKHKHDTYF